MRKNVTPPTMTPTVSKSQAHQAGLAAAKANKETATPGELVVFQSATGPKLAYEVITEGIKADQTPTKLHTIVDATTGKTLTSWDDVKEGTGNGIFVGSVSLATSGSSGAYTMKDSHGNYSTDLNQATSGNGTTFTDADDVWGTGSQSNRQSAAVDAHYGAGKTYDYYNTQLGRAGIWNNGTGARSRVHYGQNYSNAFWDGTQMTYGDGAGNAAPLVEIDVAGHEMSHGVTENTRVSPTPATRAGSTSRPPTSSARPSSGTPTTPTTPRLPHRREAQPQRQRHAAALHGQAQQGRRLEGLLELDPRQPRPALLLRPAQPLVLPGLRGLGRQDGQRRQLQQPHV